MRCSREAKQGNSKETMERNPERIGGGTWEILSENTPHIPQELAEASKLEMDAAKEGSKTQKARLLYLERFVEWLVDLLSQLPTRRFTRVLLEDSALLVKVQHSDLLKMPQGMLFAQLVDLLAFYMSECSCRRRLEERRGGATGA